MPCLFNLLQVDEELVEEEEEEEEEVGTEGAEVRGMVDNLINIAKGTTNPGVNCFNQINDSTSCQRFDNCHKLSTALTAVASFSNSRHL